MKYVALLRGINVGGNNKVSMADLKMHFQNAELENVITYINSGNVIFESSETNTKNLSKKLEQIVSKEFDVHSRILIKTKEEIKAVIENAPADWLTNQDLRCYIAFLFDSIHTVEAVKTIIPRKGVDSLKTGPGVLYMTTIMSKRTNSAFSKLAGTKIYKEMTIRNFSTTKKILSLLDS